MIIFDKAASPGSLRRRAPGSPRTLTLEELPPAYESLDNTLSSFADSEPISPNRASTWGQPSTSRRPSLALGLSRLQKVLPNIPSPTSPSTPSSTPVVRSQSVPDVPSQLVPDTQQPHPPVAGPSRVSIPEPKVVNGTVKGSPTPDLYSPLVDGAARQSIADSMLHPDTTSKKFSSNIPSPRPRPTINLRRCRSSVTPTEPPKPQTVAQVNALVLELLRDLVKQSEADSYTTSLVSGCSEACRSYGIPFSVLLQEPSLEGHSPIYWAIIRRDSHATPSSADVVTSLFSPISSLSDATISEIRLACLHNSDQLLYQQLRRWSAFNPVSGMEEMLMGGSVPHDTIVVENAPDDERAFMVRFRVPMFQKRLRISKHIALEFIARGRLWSVRLLIASAENATLRPKAKLGTCVVTLSLLEHSPPTLLDSRFVIQEVHRSASRTSSRDAAGPSRAKKAQNAPANSVRLKTGSTKLTPENKKNFLSASFKDRVIAENLQNHESSFVDADGTLEARLEARLGKPEADCVIC